MTKALVGGWCGGGAKQPGHAADNDEKRSTDRADHSIPGIGSRHKDPIRYAAPFVELAFQSSLRRLPDAAQSRK
jgi:hypothetical protein